MTAALDILTVVGYLIGAFAVSIGPCILYSRRVTRRLEAERDR